MRKVNPFLALFFLLLIPFSVYFVRPDLITSDGYGFLMLSCGQGNAVGAGGLTYSLFSLLPCSLLALKALLFSLAFVSGCFVIKLAQLFSKEHGWKACYIIFLSSIFVLDFAKLENDAFAFPLLFASLFFFFKSLKCPESSRKNLIISILLVLAAALFWQGAIFFLLAYTLNIWFLALVSVPTALFFRQQIVGAVFRTNFIGEDLPFKFHFHWILNFGLVGVFLDPLIMPQALFFFALGTVSVKFWILSLPFLVVGAVLCIEWVESPSPTDKSKGIFGKIRALLEGNISQVLFVLALFTIAGICQTIWFNEPQQEHWQAIEFALQEGEGEINNDWGMGYWVLWKQGKTESYQSPGRQKEFSPGQIIVTRLSPECTLLKAFGKTKVMKC